MFFLLKDDAVQMQDFAFLNELYLRQRGYFIGEQMILWGKRVFYDFVRN